MALADVLPVDFAAFVGEVAPLVSGFLGAGVLAGGTFGMVGVVFSVALSLLKGAV